MDGLTVPFRLHQEDFSQAMGISSGHKYEHNGEGYLKRMCDILKKYSSNPMEDQLKLWDICVFNYLIGNTDNHIKNVSLLYASDMASIKSSESTYATGIYTGKRHEKKDFRGAKAGVDVKKDICRRKFCMAGVQEQEERHMKLIEVGVIIYEKDE